MSDSETATVTKFSDEQIETLFGIIEKLLPDACEALAEADSPYKFIAVAAYLLTSIFATHPELYGEFVSLLAAFEPRYEAMAQKFAAAFPEAWAERAGDEVFIISPSVAKELPEAPAAN